MRLITFLMTLLMSCSCQTMVPELQTQSEEPKQEEEEQEHVEKPIEPKGPEATIRHGHRWLEFIGSVDQRTTDPIIEALANKGDLRGFIIEINNTGGYIDPGFKLAKAIEKAGIPVHCVVDGQAQSMAFYILQSCTTKSMTKRSFLMLHNPAIRGGQDRDTAYSYLERGEELSVLQDGMVEHYARHMKISKKDITTKLATRGWYMGWEEAKNVGAVDYALWSTEEIWFVIATYKK